MLTICVFHQVLEERFLSDSARNASNLAPLAILQRTLDERIEVVSNDLNVFLVPVSRELKKRPNRPQSRPVRDVNLGHLKRL